ncbi:MAG TPA: SDR family oxidoreductase [Streptosporangiaceae bacterium]|jgi:NAD(P)-dependent dehydrogenase (short-subunit alcohol dehydrogenase family)
MSRASEQMEGEMAADRVAVVTGASSGLGRHISRALLGTGWRVALAGRREDALRETATVSADGAGAGAADGTAGGDPAGGWPDEAALVVPADVTEPESVAALFAAVGQRWGRIDLLVNNAGTFGKPGSVDELPLADWRMIVDTNLTGAFLCAQHAVRMMKAQSPRGGRIINNGSISAQTPRPRTIGYAATKHAMTGLTKSISLDGRGFDIACGQIDIGNAATELTLGISRGAVQANGSVVPEPMFDPRHVADAVLYMASLPLDANVQFLTITATEMPFIGRG